MLKTDVCGVRFRNPLMLAAGIMGSTASSMNWILKSGAAGVISKSFSLNPHPGYKNPTTVGVDGGIMNAIVPIGFIILCRNQVIHSII